MSLPCETIFACVVLSVVASAADEPGFRSLFNGRDLTDWVDRSPMCAARVGLLHAETTAAAPLTKNTFLANTARPFGDFELPFDATPARPTPAREAISPTS